MSEVALRGFGVVFVAGVVLAPVGFVAADIASFYEGKAGEETVAALVALGAVVGYYLVTAFVTVYAVTGSILRTFLSAPPRVAASAFYLRAWLLQFVFGVALVVGSMSLPTVAGFFWLGYAPVAVSYRGRVYKETIDAGVVEPEDTAVRSDPEDVFEYAARCRAIK